MKIKTEFYSATASLSLCTTLEDLTLVQRTIVHSPRLGLLVSCEGCFDVIESRPGRPCVYQQTQNSPTAAQGTTADI